MLGLPVRANATHAALTFSARAWASGRLGDERACDRDVVEHELNFDGVRRPHVPAALRRFPVEAIHERGRRPLSGFAFRELARVGSPRMIGGNQDMQVPRRGLGMRLAVRVDHALRIAAEARRQLVASARLRRAQASPAWACRTTSLRFAHIRSAAGWWRRAPAPPGSHG